MNMLRQAHDEEYNELNNAMSTLIKANAKGQNDVLTRLPGLELSMSQW